ncbi:MAG: PAS domain S-box protein [Ignavibacteriales bacterium]|nr:PAS domain S-box protein [Ignavibacteriales bacterium]
MHNAIKILIIEDSSSLILTYLSILKNHGYLVNYKQVLHLIDYEEELENNHWDIILSQIKSAEISALNALKILRKKSLKIPLIVISSRTSEKLIVEHIKNGAANYISKKNIKTLGPVVEEVIEEQRNANETNVQNNLQKNNITPIDSIKLKDNTLLNKNIEEELYITQNEFINLSDSSPGLMGTFYQRADGSICMPYVSRQIENLYGLTPEDVKEDATKLLEKNHPDDIARVKKTIAESAKKLTPWHCEFRVVHPTRGVIWLEGSTNPKPHPEGGVIWYGFIHDITMRKIIEEQLKTKERHTKSLLRISKHLEVAKTYEEVVEFAYKEIKDIIGYNNLWVYLFNTDKTKARILAAKGPISSKLFDDIKIAELNIKGDWMLEEIATSNQPVIIEDAINDNRTNKDIIKYLGNRSIINIPINISGKILGSVGVGTFFDEGTKIPSNVELEYLKWLSSQLAATISKINIQIERDKVEIELRESEKRYRLITENTADTIAVFDLNFKPIYVSPAVKKIRGYTAEETLSQTIDQILTPKSLEIVSNELKNQLNQELNFDKDFERNVLLELEEYCKDGNIIQVETSASFIRDINKTPVSILTLSRDITERKLNEKKIIQSELKYRELTENSPYNIMLYDSEGKFLYANRNSYSELNINFSEMLGKKITVNENYPPSKIYVKKIESVLNSGIPEEFELLIPNKNNQVRNHIIKLTPEHDNNGKVIGVIAFGIDVTEEKLYKAELEESKRKFQNIIELSPIGIYQSSPEGKFLLANNKLAQILGYDSIEELLQLEIAKDIYIDSTSRSTLINQIISGSENRDYELKWKKKDGSTVWITNSVRVEKDEDGNILYFEGFVKDIDAQKKSEMDLLKLYTAVEQSSATIVITDLEGNIEYANPKFKSLTGFDIFEAKGKNPRIISSGKHSKEFYKNMWNTIKSGKDWLGEIENKKKNGELFWESAIISPIKDSNNQITNFVAIKEDITEKKRIMQELVDAKDKAEEMNRVKSIFFANMSHELRTPFVGIMGYADLLSQSLTDPEEKEMAIGLLNTAKRMRDTLTKILNLSKLEFNEIEYRPNRFDVAVTLNTIYKEFYISAQKKNIVLKIIKDFESLEINSDESLLFEILNNLVSNAVIYTEKGEIIISASIEKKNNKDILIIKVIDTGIGIPKDKQEIIWQEFRQASEGTTRNYQGIGLGLSIAKKYANLIGARIYLESEIGKGTHFYIEIPIL